VSISSTGHPSKAAGEASTSSSCQAIVDNGSPVSQNIVEKAALADVGRTSDHDAPGLDQVQPKVRQLVHSARRR